MSILITKDHPNSNTHPNRDNSNPSRDMNNNNNYTTALYASELPNNTTEAQLVEFFSKFGTVKHVKIFTRTTTKSAKISFATHEEAEHALRETSSGTSNNQGRNGANFNNRNNSNANNTASNNNSNANNNNANSKFLDKAFKITWNVDAPRRNNDCAIVINGLPPTADPQSLTNALKKYGAVTNIRVNKSPSNNNLYNISSNPSTDNINNSPTNNNNNNNNNSNNSNNNNNNSTGGNVRGIVYFSTPQIAQTAIQELNGNNVLGQKVTVTAYSRPTQSAETTPLPPYMLYHFNHHHSHNYHSNDEINSANDSDSPQENSPQTTPVPTPTAIFEDVFVLSPKLYAIVKLTGGTLAFYTTPEAAQNAYAEFQAEGNYRVTNKVTNDVLYEAFKEVEKRTVFVGGLLNATESDLRTFFEADGPIAVLSFHGKTATVQFQRVEDQHKALSHHRAIFGQQIKPIIVTPYFDRSFNGQRNPCGLLQLNELPASVRVEDLSRDFSQFGSVMITAVCPNSLGLDPVGFVLFRNYEDMIKAKAGCTSRYTNVFPYPSLNPGDAISFFLDSSNTPMTCVAIYDAPDSLNPNSLSKYGFVTAFFTFQKKTVFAYFSLENKAIEAYVSLKKEGRSVELLSGNPLYAASTALRNIALPMEWQYSFLYIQTFPEEYGNKDLRTILTERLNIKLDSCFVQLAPGNGNSIGTAIALCRSPQDAQLASNIPNVVSHQCVASYFVSRLGYTASAIPIPPPKYQLPSNQGKRNAATPREWMKQFVQLNFADKETQLRQMIENLSVNDTFQLVQDYQYFTTWIEGLVAKINA